jgi:hypothetical protein
MPVGDSSSTTPAMMVSSRKNPGFVAPRFQNRREMLGTPKGVLELIVHSPALRSTQPSRSYSLKVSLEPV